MKLNKNTKLREFIQVLGTDAMRNVIHPNVWVNALFADYRTNFEAKTVEEWGIDLGNNWLITDVRFENELEAVKERGGITIRVNRDLHKGNAHIAPIPHISETSLDHITNWDYVIDNNGTIEELIEQVKQILIKEQLI